MIDNKKRLTKKALLMRIEEAIKIDLEKFAKNPTPSLNKKIQRRVDMLNYVIKNGTLNVKELGEMFKTRLN